MTDLFNLCELRFRLYRKRLITVKLFFIKVEIFVPKIYKSYIETAQESYQASWYVSM